MLINYIWAIIITYNLLDENMFHMHGTSHWSLDSINVSNTKEIEYNLVLAVQVLSWLIIMTG